MEVEEEDIPASNDKERALVGGSTSSVISLPSVCRRFWRFLQFLRLQDLHIFGEEQLISVRVSRSGGGIWTLLFFFSFVVHVAQRIRDMIRDATGENLLERNLKGKK